MPKKKYSRRHDGAGTGDVHAGAGQGQFDIASTLKPETLNRAIAEILNGFCQVHGLQAAPGFS